MFTDLPPEEVERRRLISQARMREIEQEEWEARYQATCDRLYWSKGRCCAGCDHWSSYAGLSGQCSAAGIMSGADVMRSLGFTFWSYEPAPDFPYTRAEHVCGLFKDEFDWSTLSPDYLRSIGAIRNGTLRGKP
jgi:hypothetical protein